MVDDPIMKYRYVIMATALLLVAASRPALAQPVIAVNQVGFAAHWRKQAMLVLPVAVQGVAAAKVALVRNLDVGTSTSVPIGPRRKDPGTGDWLAIIDLTAVRRPGRYQIQIGDLRSTSFMVAAKGSHVYSELERLLLRSFYLQRCGVQLHDQAPGATSGIHHAACHRSDGQLADSSDAAAQSWDTTGGWHDAGDYGKYVATTAVSIGRILHAFERDPARFSLDDLGIPESGNGIPDVLDEMKIGLDWMLKMQRADGAVYRKVGGKQWPKKLVPELDEQSRYVYGVTSPETAKAAAAWALAARLIGKAYPREAALYLSAARRAWSWLEQQPAQVFDWRQGDDSGSGPYRSNEVDIETSLLDDSDDRLWAATELAITTREPAWFPIVTRLAATAPIHIYEWKDASLLALSYFLWHPALKRYSALARRIGQRIVTRAEVALAQSQRSGYRIANPRFVWGSNKMTVEEGVLMCMAYSLTQREPLLASARDQLHYVLGRNHFATSFVSGVGDHAVRNVTHIFAEAANLQLPGLFVGGPNEAEQANIAPRHRGALSWIDDRRSYATNEYAIDYNASLIGLLAMLEGNCEPIRREL
jgi:endoglucanase